MEDLRNDPRFKRYKFNGKELTLYQWSKETNIKEHTLYYRIHKYNWSVEDALTIGIENNGICKSKFTINKNNLKNNKIKNKYIKIFKYLIKNLNINNHI